jgi:hypothetical protein
MKTEEMRELNIARIKPILGQEAICPDGLGRVVDFRDDFPVRWVQVSTYVNDRSCKWDPDNVELIDPRPLGRG